MKFLLLHGNHLSASRQFFIGQKIQAKKQGLEILAFEGKKLDLSQLKQAVESRSLFGTEKAVFIENFFSLPKSQNQTKIFEYLKNSSVSLPLTIWEGRQIDGRKLKAFSAAEVRLFKIPPVVFKFLDSFFPGNNRNCLNFLHQTLKTEAPELVFYLLARRVGDLIIAADLGPSGLAKMAPWQKTALFAQAKKFSLPRLLRLHHSLLATDRDQKTGRNVLNLSQKLDLLILAL